MKVKQLGAILFEMNYMEVEEDLKPLNVLSEAIISMAGNHIVFESSITTPYITLDSGQDSWVTDQQRLDLLAMWGALDTTYTLTYENDSTETVRMAREKSLIFTPISEANCDYYTVMIPLAKVE